MSAFFLSPPILLCLLAFSGSYGIWKLIRLSPALRYLFNGERPKKRAKSSPTSFSGLHGPLPPIVL